MKKLLDTKLFSIAGMNVKVKDVAMVGVAAYITRHLDDLIARRDLQVDLSRSQFQGPPAELTAMERRLAEAECGPWPPSTPSTRDLSPKTEAPPKEVTKAVGYCRAVDDGIEE